MEVVVNLFYYLNIYIFGRNDVYVYIYMNIFERRYEPNGRHT